MVWYGMVWYGMVWYGMVWYGMVWYGMVWYGMVWYGMVWYGMVWYGMVWYGMVWYGMKVNSEHCAQNIVNNNKTQYKQANLKINNKPCGTPHEIFRTSELHRSKDRNCFLFSR